MKKNRFLAILLCLCVLMSTVVMSAGASDSTSTITVNYVYASNSGMVAQPYTAQVITGETFQTVVAAPEITNYTAAPSDTLPAGVTFTDNKLTFDLTVSGDITILINYTAGTATYTVNHYQQNIVDDDYTLFATAEVEGSIDAYTQAVANIYPGFTCTGVPEYVVAADGSTVVNIYYLRNYFMVTFDLDGGINGPDPIYAKYGAAYDTSTLVAPTKAGYTFSGWDVAPTGVVTGNVTYTAQWTLKSADSNVTIVYWGENANDEEYSYLGAQSVTAAVGSVLSWDNLSTTLICGKEEHVHGASCYSNFADQTAVDNPGVDNPINGCIYRTGGPGRRTYYIYFTNGGWYVVDSTWARTGNNGSYIRDGNPPVDGKLTLTCTQEEHTHDSSCYINSFVNTDLYEYVRSDTVTVAADGSTVMNVYYNRVVFKITFKDGNNDVKTLSEKWGADIIDAWPVVGSNGTTYDSGERWKPSDSATYKEVLVFIAVMPAESFTLTCDRANKDTYIMKYNVEVLPGGTGTLYSGKTYTTLFTVTANYNYVTEAEDFFALEGFTKNTSNPEFLNGEIDIRGGGTVDFYYTRNSYDLKFFNGNNANAEKTESVKYQASLASYDYTPTTKPAGVESDAVFAGWYLNPECTGDEYILSAHTMPSREVALYAKWVNRTFEVKTWTDSTLKTLFTYDGYEGSQTVTKYQLATALEQDPTSATEAFVGWFYTEGGVEKPFSFEMPITKDYDLYPKFSDQVMVDYVVHYYLKETTTSVAPDKNGSAMIGSTVTEKAKMGTELSEGYQTGCFPKSTSTSIQLKSSGNEIIFYYTQATDITYTVKYQDPNGTDLIESVVKTTSYSVVTEQYVVIPNYTPRQYQQTLELVVGGTNEIIFIYDPNLTDLTITKTGAQSTDENQSFIFTVVGDQTNDKTKDINLTVTIIGNGSVTIRDLPTGNYTVTEATGWSWRYTPGSASQKITLNVDPTLNTVTFANSRTEAKWLNGMACADNNFRPMPD